VGAGSSRRIVLDLNSPEFLDVFLRLEPDELAQVVRSLARLRTLDWDTVYRSKGLHWEAIDHIRTPTGATAYSVRLSGKCRAIAYRDGDYLRLMSLHPDHDSAYRR
jgi:hypothetical protein